MIEFPIPNAPPDAGIVNIVHGDGLEYLHSIDNESLELIYIDPPFNTRRKQVRKTIQTEKSKDGDRVGYQGHRYMTTVLGSSFYTDSFDDYISFLVPRLRLAHHRLTPNGSLFVHLDYREVHYIKIELDKIFGRDCFINEIIWAYDYGARSRTKWSTKHDTILWYAKNPRDYIFNYAEIDRIPYMAPDLVGEEKAARGKTPTDTWWNTIVSPTGNEKTGYPTQKPLAILKRIVAVHSNPGDACADFFAGSGSFGIAAASLGRNVTLVDSSPEAIETMTRRFTNYNPNFWTVPRAENVEEESSEVDGEAEIGPG